MKSHHIRLIDSTYPVEQAYEVLISLIEDKIRFINNKIFSLEEQYGSAPAHMKKRISELKQEVFELRSFLDAFDGEEAEVNIGCTVSINVHTNQLA